MPSRRSDVGTLWSVTATVASGRRTPRPAIRRPSKACGEVTSWTRWRSMYSRSGSPSAWCTTWRSQTLSAIVRGTRSSPSNFPLCGIESRLVGDSVSGVGVLDKAVSVLDALEDGPQALAGLAAATGLPRATAHRLAAALAVHGLVGRDDAGRFVLGPRLVSLGRAAGPGRRRLAELAAPALTAL